MPMDEKLTAANLLPSRQKEYSISISTRSKRSRKQYLESIARNLESSLDVGAQNCNESDDLFADSNITPTLFHFLFKKNFM
jgi:hypothetical protein